jgi:hypothetical protein
MRQLSGCWAKTTCPGSALAANAQGKRRNKTVICRFLSLPDGCSVKKTSYENRFPLASFQNRDMKKYLPCRMFSSNRKGFVH